jgi:hypothetical protein
MDMDLSGRKLNGFPRWCKGMAGFAWLLRVNDYTYVEVVGGHGDLTIW